MKREKEKIVALNNYIHETSSSGSEVVKENAFIAGFEIADKTMLDRACEWLKNRHNIEKCLGVLTSRTEDLAKVFRQAMEGGAE